MRLFLEGRDGVAVKRHDAGPLGWPHRRDRRIPAMILMESQQRRDIHVTHAAAVGETEGIVVTQAFVDPAMRPPVMELSPVSTSVMDHGSAVFRYVINWFLAALMVVPEL
ncbi:hypothetical protein [Nitrospirillum iridis]|uniref:Uncharacterized protein n=1 Tax=Nitrospirillum iridis TaxID=765888 RepID=A0A7X0B554_9PROT|nr:hypothetical protein [Nitrospirillum iridis]MBB6255191.1 hypothetical protein [Nitrospirillum iridis]